MSFLEWKKDFEGKKIIIWGASIGGNQAFWCMEKNGVAVEAYCDNNEQKHGTLYNGKMIISPERLKQQMGGAQDYIVVIASFAYEVIYKQIQELGINCAVYIYLLYDLCHVKNGVVYVESEKKEICSIYSPETYTSTLLGLILEKGLLNSSAFGKIEEYSGFGGIDAYYYDNIAERIINEAESALTLLDVGSWVGDSILQIRRVFGKQIRRIYGFEPSAENCAEIMKKNIDDFTLYRVGLSNKNGQMSFSGEGPFFRASGKEDGIQTQIIKLDDIDLKIDGKCILKMDIEGSEMDCLEGAKEFIKEYKPYIAVCVYHREKDILDIPKYIRGLVPEYKFLLRGGMHTVCYAFPEGDAKNECNR